MEKGYRKLIVYKYKRMLDLVKLVYKMTESYPKSELFGLTSQMRRAVVSVISNFVEGYLKISKKEILQFIERSKTSLLELSSQVEVSLTLNLIVECQFEEFEHKEGEVSFLLYRYVESIVNST